MDNAYCFLFKQKTAYDMLISDWRSDVCSSDLIDIALGVVEIVAGMRVDPAHGTDHFAAEQYVLVLDHIGEQVDPRLVIDAGVEEHVVHEVLFDVRLLEHRSEEHTSELQSLMRISYAVFCLKKKNKKTKSP